MRKQLLSSPNKAGSTTAQELVLPSIPGDIGVVELPDRQPRQLDALRVHINQLLADQWLIASRSPLTLQRGPQVRYVLYGMLLSESL